MDVIRVDYHAIGCGAVLFPDWPIIETLQTVEAALHIFEATNPDIVIGLTDEAELSEDVHIDGCLSGDEVGFEVVDEVFQLVRLEQVIADFEYRKGHIKP